MCVAWILAGLLLTILLVLCVKLWLLQRSMDEICRGLEEHLSQDTNTLLSISSGDKYVRKLAAGLNQQLRLLRKQRQQYLNGDRELKDAVTNISHDLRTPLTAICGYLALLEREEKSENVTRYLSYIESRTQAMKQLTEELFRYSVILSTDEEMTLERVNLNGVLEESIAAFYAALTERGITPDIQMPAQPVMRRLNRAALSRVFGNLLTNALKYSDGDLEISLSASGRICFSNTASQFDEIQVGRLFDRFFSVESARNATGLGLAIAKTLVEQMNGTITAQYSGQKLQITVCFPEERPSAQAD